MSTNWRNFHVTGRVQGVGFRAATRRHAEALGLTGWVRNCQDGSVEVLASGCEADLTALENWLQQGPQFARVDAVRTCPGAPADMPVGEFRIR